MIPREVKGGARRGTSANATSSITNSTCSDFGFDPIIGGGRPATNHPSNGSECTLWL